MKAVLQLRSWLARCSGVVLIGMIGSCSAVPQTVTIKVTPSGGEVIVGWDGHLITVEGLENALEKVQEYLQESIQAGDSDAAEYWLDLHEEILAAKREAVQSVATPGAAVIRRPTPQQAMVAYEQMKSRFVQVTCRAFASGVPASDLAQVKAALLNQ